MRTRKIKHNKSIEHGSATFTKVISSAPNSSKMVKKVMPRKRLIKRPLTSRNASGKLAKFL
jgi:hypothetical protein